MSTTADADILAVIDRFARQATPAEIRERFGPDVDIAEAMKFLTVLD